MARKITIPKLMEISKKNYIYLAKNLWTNTKILCENDLDLPDYVVSLSLTDPKKIYRVEIYKGKIYPVECMKTQPDSVSDPVSHEGIINFLENRRKEGYLEASVKKIKKDYVGLETTDPAVRLNGLVWIKRDYYNYVISAGQDKSATQFYIKGLYLPILFNANHLLEGAIMSKQ